MSETTSIRKTTSKIAQSVSEYPLDGSDSLYIHRTGSMDVSMAIYSQEHRGYPGLNLLI